VFQRKDDAVTVLGAGDDTGPDDTVSAVVDWMSDAEYRRVWTRRRLVQDRRMGFGSFSSRLGSSDEI
jgi:hypothetical protein